MHSICLLFGSIVVYFFRFCLCSSSILSFPLFSLSFPFEFYFFRLFFFPYFSSIPLTSFRFPTFLLSLYSLSSFPFSCFLLSFPLFTFFFSTYFLPSLFALPLVSSCYASLPLSSHLL